MAIVPPLARPRVCAMESPKPAPLGRAFRIAAIEAVEGVLDILRLPFPGRVRHDRQSHVRVVAADVDE